MYKNLEVKIFENDLSKKEIAKSIGISYNSFLAKLHDKQPMKLDECFKIRDLFFPCMPLDYLFSKNENK